MCSVPWPLPRMPACARPCAASRPACAPAVCRGRAPGVCPAPPGLPGLGRPDSRGEGQAGCRRPPTSHPCPRQSIRLKDTEPGPLALVRSQEAQGCPTQLASLRDGSRSLGRGQPGGAERSPWEVLGRERLVRELRYGHAWGTLRGLCSPPGSASPLVECLVSPGTFLFGGNCNSQ